MQPLPLRFGFRYRHASRHTGNFDGLFRVDPRYDERPGREETRAPNALTAMHGHALAFTQDIHDSGDERGRVRERGGKTLIRRSVREESDAGYRSQFSLARQSKFAGFLLFEHGNHDVELGLPPTGNLILEPVAATRPRHDEELAGPRARDRV